MSKKKEYRSKRAISRALISLLASHTYHEITVQDIINESQYSKSTFYVHFLDKDDLLNYILSEEVSTYVDCTTRRVIENNKQGVNLSDLSDQVFEGILEYFQHVYENRNLYKYIASKRIPGISLETLAERNFARVSTLFSLSAEPPHETLDVNLFLYQCCHTYMHYVKYWISHDFAFSSKYMAEQASVFLKSSIPIQLSCIKKK